jgi:hypothetical protein
MKQSSFRMWVANLWHDNLEERLIYKEQQISMDEYWNKYKWWLKREYTHLKRKNKQ